MGKNSAQTRPDTTSFRLSARRLLCGSLLVLLGAAIHLRSQLTAQLCPQATALFPTRHREVWKTMDHVLSDTAFKEAVVEWLAGAIRVPTEVFDDMGAIGADERWLVFKPFHDYLQQAFPNVNKHLDVTIVNTYGLIYEWKGTNLSLKPLLLTAHQDVVPVEQSSLKDWTFPPFSGHFDGDSIWGRGSLDDKNGLIGAMIAIEELIKTGFKPTRSVVLAFGFDEEISTGQGAPSLAITLERMYGHHGYAMIVDEGDPFSEQFGSIFATPAVAEKGYADVRITVNTPGGHSSLPPDHTAIGVLSRLLVHLENEPVPAKLNRDTPLYGALQCYAAHGSELPTGLAHAVHKSTTSDRHLKRAQDIVFQDPYWRSLASTTQAIDLVQGGHKANALPESAWAIVNHRIATDSSGSRTHEEDTARLLDLAEAFNLSVQAFGVQLSSEGRPVAGSLVLADAWGGAPLEPAPITRTDPDAEPFEVLSGTIRAVYSSHRDQESAHSGIVVAPGILGGNTDTASYWNLSSAIFRYNHHGPSTISGLHTVNEHILLSDFLEMIRFFTMLVLNVDESTL
ncbi:carboxypeptidase S [Peniophora sp. CONT]|nr:carboxypeptidase S [Peniophora sp. CONT]